VDKLRQTYATHKAIENLEARLLERHLSTCVPRGIAEGAPNHIVAELMSLCDLKPATSARDHA
jgi:DNA-binding FrmR family transcriptional regulator